MAEPLLGAQPLVGEWAADAGLWLVRGWTAGPAGTAPVHLGGGIELDLDVADPGTVAGLSLPAPGQGDPSALPARTHGMLVRLLGDRRLSELLSLAGGTGPTTRALDGFPVTRRGSREEDEGADSALGRLGLAHLTAADRSLPPAVRGLALLEAGQAGRALGAGLGVGNRAVGDTSAGAELLVAAADSGALRVPDVVALSVSHLLRRAARSRALDPGTARRLLALANGLDAGQYRQHTLRPDFGDVAMAAAAAPTPAMAPPPKAARRVRGVDALQVVREPVTIDRRSLPFGLPGTAVRAERRDPHEVEVRIAGWAGRTDGWWARAFAADGSIVAMAPFTASGRDAASRLLVPANELTHVEADVTDVPEVARPSLSLRASEDAIRAGRTAARAERLRDVGDASDAWTECARLWVEASDTTRSALANALAQEVVAGRRDATTPALLSDHLPR